MQRGGPRRTQRLDVMSSAWNCTLEGLPHPPAVRLGLRGVAGWRG